MLYFFVIFVPLAPAALLVASLLRAASMPTPEVPRPKRKPVRAATSPDYQETHQTLVGSSA